MKINNSRKTQLATVLGQTSLIKLFCCLYVLKKFIKSVTEMEKPLDKVLDEILNSDGVIGCVVSDKQGLCLGSKGNASSESSGLITAISECAKNLHSSESAPTIILENNEKQCVIHSNDTLVVSIYKNIAA